MAADLWFKNSVVYSLDVETFLDGNGDGCGDFEGLAHRLDYLAGLGVDTLWLAPFQPSPNRDDGYDITDFYAVDPRFGTPGDFVDFMREANGRGLRVVADLVVNHTSDRHPWFAEARRGPRSRRYGWYVWSKRRPADVRSGTVFPGVEDETWTYLREARAYYFHRFYRFQPDLNMENPEVRAEVHRVIGYWLALGVAGFRVDAVPFVIEKPQPGGGAPELRFEYLRAMRDVAQWRRGDAVLLGEANVLPRESQRYFADGDGLHLMFNFWVNQHLFLALASGDARPLAEALRATRRIPASAQWAHFLRNHDELDLGHLDDGGRELVYERFGPEPSMQLYGRGLRRRLAPMLGDRRRIDLAYSLLFALPGTPVVRYGDEIGMGENLSLRERAAIRTPMQWANAPHAGFTTAERPVRPVVDRGPYAYEHVNADGQRRDASSLLRTVTRLIRVRKECPEIGWGDWRVVPTRTPGVLALASTWRGDTVVTVHNLEDARQEVTLRLDDDTGTLSDLFAEEDVAPGPRASYRVPLEAYGYRWFRGGAPSTALRHRPELR